MLNNTRNPINIFFGFKKFLTILKMSLFLNYNIYYNILSSIYLDIYFKRISLISN